MSEEELAQRLEDDDSSGGIFVVQQHSARRLHYDFRLQIGHRLVSWAVPKGPSMDPGQRRLAVRVEDHPLEHAQFEGVIPAGEYGAGEVIIWDKGTWRPLDEDPEKALQEGKLLFLLGGHKLRGRFVLVRTRYKGERENWLLIKLKDKYATPGEDITAQRPESVLTGRTITDLRLWAEAIREIATELPQLAGAEKAPMPTALPPMWPAGVRDPFCEHGWLFEVERQGERALAFCDGSSVVFRNARQEDITGRVAKIARFLAFMRLPRVVMDGVLVRDEAASGPGDDSSEQSQADQAFEAFDLLHFADYCLLRVPLAERRRLLSKLLPDAGPVRFIDHIAIDGQAACAQAARVNARVVAKKADSLYKPGEKSEDWLILRAREERPAAPGLLSPEEAAALAEEIRSTSHRSATIRAGEYTVKLTNLDKVFWPPWRDRPPIYKRDMIAYYAEVSPWLLPYLADRPLTLRRYVDGIDGESFYQRDWHYRAPEFVRLVKIYAPSAGRDVRTVVCDNLATLLWLANTADVEMHAWYARCSNDGNAWPEDALGSEQAVEASSLNYPDYIVFDLDPWIKAGGSIEDEGQRLAALRACAQVAQIIRERIGQWGLEAYVKTSGKTGLHVWVPLERRYRFETTRQVAYRLAAQLAEEYPDLVTVQWRVEKREGRVFIDHMQNVRGKTLPAPYSLRATHAATVSMPLRWEDLEEVDSFDCTLTTVPQLLRTRLDPWGDIFQRRNSLRTALKQLSIE